MLRKVRKHSAMGAIKRKADQEAASSKNEKASSNDRSAKRQRKSDTASEHISPSKPTTERSAQKSIFQEDERAFPRGGASVLTPLEHKQIQVKANQDVLFEQAGLKRGGDDVLSEEGSKAGDDAPKVSKISRSKKSKKMHEEEATERKLKAEGLTLKVCSTVCSMGYN